LLYRFPKATNGAKILRGWCDMRGKKQINTTLGELIAAVTEEVMPVAGNRANANALVSYILNDLFSARRVRLRRRSALKGF
jgi:hypothetical protein